MGDIYLLSLLGLITPQRGVINAPAAATGQKGKIHNKQI